MPSGDLPVIDNKIDLANWLAEKGNEGSVVRTHLRASERVIARVTDGIYRQPASAIRELISNAWDADAKNVTILTDAPRFSRIYVRDDGAGMSYETLARLLHSIGGSAKRREDGQTLGVTDPKNSELTPGGRRLIGKIGIGLFSVSQLARRFKIVTKAKGTDYRLIAEVRLRAYSEDGSDDEIIDSDDEFVSGDVYITREPASDIDGHGTDIVLDDIKPRVRDILRSADRWAAIKEKATLIEAGDLDAASNIRIEEPKFHAGWFSGNPKVIGPAILSRPANLPWTATDSSEIRMSKLMDSVEQEFSRLERPDLATTLDNYLEMVWTLGLSIPVAYVDKHPFDLTSDARIRAFWISNESRGQGQELDLSKGQTVRSAVAEQITGQTLEEGREAAEGNFKVHMDGIELKRPIRFKFLPTEKRGLENAMLFVGKYSPNLTQIDASQRGGQLELEAYLYWNGRIVPKENNGVLVRIRGASGALFDPTFFKYQISEQTRLRQITAELFIRNGLDAALNIDRESFNFSHPHVMLVTIWLHRAIRQLTNKHKDLSHKRLVERRDVESTEIRSSISQHSEEVWTKLRGADPAPEISITTDPISAQAAREEGYLAVSRSDIPTLGRASSEKDRQDRDTKAVALLRVLAAYGVLTDKPYIEQQNLVDAILAVFFGPQQK